MKQAKNFSIIVTFMLALLVYPMSDSFAAKTGSSCKKLNAKSRDGNNPLVCKKNSKGKLVWTAKNSDSKPGNASNSDSKPGNASNSDSAPEAILEIFTSGTWGETLFRWYDISLKNSSQVNWLWMTDYELFLQDAQGNTFENRKITIPPIPPGGKTSFVETTNVRFPLADKLIVRPVTGGFSRNPYPLSDQPTNVGSFQLTTTKPFGDAGRACLSAIFTVKNNSQTRVLQKDTRVYVVIFDTKQNNRPLAAAYSTLPTDVPPGGTVGVDQCYLWHNPSIDPILAATVGVKITYNPYFRT